LLALTWMLPFPTSLHWPLEAFWCRWVSHLSLAIWSFLPNVFVQPKKRWTWLMLWLFVGEGGKHQKMICLLKTIKNHQKPLLWAAFAAARVCMHKTFKMWDFNWVFFGTAL
jgi:hypothetical protein